MGLRRLYIDQSLILGESRVEVKDDLAALVGEAWVRGGLRTPHTKKRWGIDDANKSIAAKVDCIAS
jgi:hypothetical protein